MEEEELNLIKKTLDDLTVKIDELSKIAGNTIVEKKEYTDENISKHPLAYVLGSFLGGMIVGYAISNKRCDK